jgi:hypothetical protein
MVEQGDGMSTDLIWRVALLSAVFVSDLVVFIGLVREEVRDWRVNRSASGAR